MCYVSQGHQNGYFNGYYGPIQGRHNYNKCSDYFYPPNFSNNNRNCYESYVGAEEEISDELRELMIAVMAKIQENEEKTEQMINRLEIQVEGLKIQVEVLIATLISLQTKLSSMGRLISTLATRLGIVHQPCQFPTYQNRVFIGYYSYQGDNSCFQSGNHHHFSYYNSNNALQPCLGFPVEHQMIDEPKKQSTDGLLVSLMGETKSFMENSYKQISRLETTVATMSSTIISMATQIEKLATIASIQFQQKGEHCHTVQTAEETEQECPKAQPILTPLQPQIPLSSQRKLKLKVV